MGQQGIGQQGWAGGGVGGGGQFAQSGGADPVGAWLQQAIAQYRSQQGGQTVH
jgi:hypothetical protein